MVFTPGFIPGRPKYPIAEIVDREWSMELIRLLEARDRAVDSALHIVQLSKTFAIDSQALITVTYDHIFGYIPTGVQNCQISISQNTAVDDWAYDLLKVVSISATQVVAKINVSTASGTGSATANMNVWVRPYIDK